MTKPMTVQELITELSRLAPDAAVYVQGSNGWGPGARRAAYSVVVSDGDVSIRGAYL